jgi:glycosyltransferase involved in cell wall biosynthesis
MKIIIPTFMYDSSLAGGAARVVELLSEGLTNRGVEVTVITSKPETGISVDIINRIKVIRFFPKNLYWINHKDRQSTLNKTVWQIIDTWNPFVYRTVKDIFQSENPDIVHVHKLRGLSPAVWSAAKASGFKEIVHTCHDYELLSPVGLLDGKIGELAKKQNFLLYPYQKLRRSTSNSIVVATAPSDFTLKLHLNMGFFSNAKHKVTPNTHGYSMKELTALRDEMNKKTHENGHSLRMLYLGRLDTSKGIEVLCDAVIDCEKKKSNVHLDVVGWGSIEEKLKEKYGASKSIRFCGPKYGEQKNQILKECDIVVVPSIVLEVFGIVIAEAYAYGKPVLASNIGGIPEIVIDHQTGFLVEPNDARKLSDQIQFLARNKRMLASMKQACFSMAQNLSAEKFLNNYMLIYSDL